jgi:hypothetical protein
MTLDEVDTPALVIDLDAISANNAYVLGSTGDGALWQERARFGTAPPARANSICRLTGPSSTDCSQVKRKSGDLPQAATAAARR